MHRILLILIFSPSLTLAQNSFDQDLGDYIDFRTRKGRYSGVTSIFKNGELIFQNVGGEANRSWSVPNRPDTRFNLASGTKMFTATGIGILADRGLLNLDDKIGDHFPEFPNGRIARSVSLKELLSHTSGLSDLFFEKSYLESDKNRLRSLKDYDRFLSSLRKTEVPQNHILYSNSNYIILGRIIEKVAGVSYYDFVNHEIFERSGMQNTGFYEADLVIKNLAEGYSTDRQASMEFGVPNDKKLRKNSYMKAVKGMPAGGAYSTTRDMYLFMEALISGQIITQITLKTMTTEVQGGYGLGFQVYEQNGVQLWGHSGGFYGVSTMVFYLPSTGHTFVSLTNSDFAAQPVFDRFINLLTGVKTYQPIAVDSGTIKSFGGLYEVYEGEMLSRQISIEPQKDLLIFDKELEFYPIGTDRFFDIDNDLFTLSFIRDATDKIIGFERTDGRRFHQKAHSIDLSRERKLTPLSISDELLKQFLGDYQFGQEGMMAGHKPQIIVDKGGLLIDNMMKFLPFEKDKFFMQDDQGMQLHFQRNDQGQITGIHILRQKEVVGRVKKLN